MRVEADQCVNLAKHVILDEFGTQLKQDQSLSQIQEQTSQKFRDSVDSRNQSQDHLNVNIQICLKSQIFVFKPSPLTENALDSDDLYCTEESVEQHVLPYLEKIMPNYEAYLDPFDDKQMGAQANDIDEAILDSEKGINAFFANSKEKFLDFEMKAKGVKISTECCFVQFKSVSVLVQHTIKNYENLKEQKHRLAEQLRRNEAENQETLKTLEQSLQKMKNLPLHSALQTNNKKYLVDVYHPPQKIASWREKCLSQQGNVRGKMDHFQSHIKQIKGKIKQQKDKRVPQMRERRNDIKNLVDSRMTQAENLAFQNMKKIFVAYKAFKDEISNYVQGNYGSKDEAFGKVLYHKGICDELVRNSPKIEEFFDSQKLDSLVNEAKSAKGFIQKESLNAIRDLFKSCNQLVDISCKLLAFEKSDVKNCQNDMHKLLMPQQMLDAYEATLVEVSRRRAFMKHNYESYKEVRNLFESENKERRVFLEKYGKLLPYDFLPDISSILPELPSDSEFKEEHELPIIEGYHQDVNSGMTINPNQFSKQNLKQLEDLKKHIQQLKAENRQSSAAQITLENEIYNLKATLMSAEEKIENSKKIYTLLEEDAINVVDYSKYMQLTEQDYLSTEERKAIIRQLLDHTAKSVYYHLAPQLVSKNQEISDIKKRFENNKEFYEKELKEKEASFSKTIDEYIKKVESINHNNINLSIQLNKEKESSQQLLQHLEGENNALSQELERRIKQHQDQKHEQQQRYKQEILRANEQITKWKDQADNMKVELSKHSSKLQQNSEASQKLNGLQNQLEEAQNSLEEANRLNTERLKKINSLSLELNDKKEAICEMEARIDKLENDKSRLKEDLQESKEQVATMEYKIDNLNTQIQTMTNNNTYGHNQGTYNRNNDDMETQMPIDNDTQISGGDSIIQLSTARREIETLQTNYEELKEENQTTHQKYQNIKKLLDEEEAECKKLKKRIREKEREIKDLKDEIEQTQRDLGEAKANETRKIRVAEEFQNINKALSEQNQNLETRFSKLQVDIEAKNKLLESSRAELSNKKDEIVRFEKAIEQSKEDKKELQDRLRQISGEMISLGTPQIGHISLFYKIYGSYFTPIFQNSGGVEYTLRTSNIPLEGHSIIVGKVIDIKNSAVNLNSNRQLVSFTSSSAIKMIEIDVESSKVYRLPNESLIVKQLK